MPFFRFVHTRTRKASENACQHERRGIEIYAPIINSPDGRLPACPARSTIAKRNHCFAWERVYAALPDRPDSGNK